MQIGDRLAHRDARAPGATVGLHSSPLLLLGLAKRKQQRIRKCLEKRSLEEGTPCASCGSRAVAMEGMPGMYPRAASMGGMGPMGGNSVQTAPPPMPAMPLSVPEPWALSGLLDDFPFSVVAPAVVSTVAVTAAVGLGGWWYAYKYTGGPRGKKGDAGTKSKKAKKGKRAAPDAKQPSVSSGRAASSSVAGASCSGASSSGFTPDPLDVDDDEVGDEGEWQVVQDRHSPKGKGKDTKQRRAQAQAPAPSPAAAKASSKAPRGKATPGGPAIGARACRADRWR